MKKAPTRKATIFGKLKILSLSILFLMIVMGVFCGFLLTAVKFHDLNWENYLLNRKVEADEGVIKDLLEERAFEKEMKENLSYYLPEGYHSTATFLNMSPIDYEYGKSRVTFLYRSRIYYIDFSYYPTFYGWHVDQESPVTLKL